MPAFNISTFDQEIRQEGACIPLLIQRYLSQPPDSRDNGEIERAIVIQKAMTKAILSWILASLVPDERVRPEPKDLQVDIVRRQVFAQQDSLLLAQTGFGKSLIFQAFSTMTGLMSIIVAPLLGLSEQIKEDISVIPGQ